MSEEKKSLVVKSSVRDLLGEMRASEDFWDKLNEVVEKEVKNAIERAKANGRKTVRGCDL
jgi:histone H3/H4